MSGLVILALFAAWCVLLRFSFEAACLLPALLMVVWLCLAPLFGVGA